MADPTIRSIQAFAVKEGTGRFNTIAGAGTDTVQVASLKNTGCPVAIAKGHIARSMLDSTFPQAAIDFAIGPNMPTFTMGFAGCELSFVNTTLNESQSTPPLDDAASNFTDVQISIMFHK